MINKEEHGLIEFPAIGGSSDGFITVAETQKGIPFEIKRVYWTYYTPQDIIRGFHAHKNLYQVIFAVCGKIVFRIEDRQSREMEYVLDKPNVGLYLPPYTWREIRFSHSAVLMCLASELYNEEDYIRSYETFKHAIGKG